MLLRQQARKPRKRHINQGQLHVQPFDPDGRIGVAASGAMAREAVRLGFHHGLEVICAQNARWQEVSAYALQHVAGKRLVQ